MFVRGVKVFALPNTVSATKIDSYFKSDRSSYESKVTMNEKIQQKHVWKLKWSDNIVNVSQLIVISHYSACAFRSTNTGSFSSQRNDDEAGRSFQHCIFESSHDRGWHTRDICKRAKSYRCHYHISRGSNYLLQDQNCKDVSGVSDGIFSWLIDGLGDCRTRSNPSWSQPWSHDQRFREKAKPSHWLLKKVKKKMRVENMYLGRACRVDRSNTKFGRMHATDFPCLTHRRKPGKAPSHWSSLNSISLAHFNWPLED